MEYISKEIKKGIKMHYIKTDIFKTNLIAIFLTTKLEKDTVTLNTLIPAVLRRGSITMPTQEDISKTLENMYGASFDCGSEKIGDNQSLKFYIESLNNNFLLENENIMKESIDKLLEIVFNPVLEENVFKDEYVQSEKVNIKQLIQSKIDMKDKYAQERCIEIMYEGKPYGVYKYGYEEDLEKISSKDLYEQYKKLIENCKIDIFVSGDFNNEETEQILKENENIKKLKERNAQYIENNEETEKKEEQQVKTVEEKLDVSQGKLVIGLDVNEYSKDSRYAVSLYNVLLGGSANSKLFQNVREKASLAYTAGSIYLRQKNNIFIKAGIEIKNYQKALDIIKQQLDEMKNGNFTEEDIEKAKRYMLYGIKAIEDDQELGISYYIAQELSRNKYKLRRIYCTCKFNNKRTNCKHCTKNSYKHNIFFKKLEKGRFYASY